MDAVYRKELRSYFSNMSGYIPIALILMMTGIFVKLYSLNYGYPQMEVALPNVTLVLLFAIPILAMRSFAEERRQKTDILLYSLPVTTGQIVAGKYFAMMTVLAVPCGIMLLIPFLMSMYGKVNLLMSICAVVAFYLLCAAMTAICMFMSSLTESQIIAAVISFITLLCLYASSMISEAIPTTPVASFISVTVMICLVGLIVYVFTKNYWIAFGVAVAGEIVALAFYLKDNTLYTGLAQKIISAISIFTRIDAFVTDQLFDMTAVVYYISIAFAFCFLTAQVVDKRRYN
ncbi:MAG: ABC-2 transporter permease [Clostridia bacterium]|nr:ABC-2 transporter permease [Clostridia bacterium]